MAIDKSNTPAWMKVVLWVVIIAFVMSFIGLGGTSIYTLFTGGQSKPANTTANASDALKQQYQPQVDAFTQLLQSEPTSYTVLVNLGNTYMDWAGGLEQTFAQAQQSQLTTAQAELRFSLYTNAKDAYDKALKIKATEAPVLGDYAITLYSTGDVNGAILWMEKAVVIQPDLPVLWFNLGNFYAQAGQLDKSKEALNRYLKLDPKGDRAQAAKDALKKLDEAAAQTTSTP